MAVRVRRHHARVLLRLRACEIKGLRWQDVDRTNRLLHVRRSKTPAGWRSPTLNATCLHVLQELYDRAAQLGFAQADHFVFPWHGRSKRLDPTKPMASRRTAWRSIRKAAGLKLIFDSLNRKTESETQIS